MALNNFSVSSNGSWVTIKVNTDEFNFKAHREFRNIYKDLPGDTSIILDLANTQYMDSSAIGMLMVLWQHIGGAKFRMRIINCNETLLKILSIAKLEQLFDIEPTK